MSSPRVWQWAAALPVLGFLLAYASLGRLDPAYWLGEPPGHRRGANMACQTRAVRHPAL